MIIRMSKVEILGPKQIAEQVLDGLRQCGTLHLREWTREPPPHAALAGLPCLADNPEMLSQQIYYEDALESIDSVLKLMSDSGGRLTYLNTPALLPSLLALNIKHHRYLSRLQLRSQELQGQLQSLRLHRELFTVLQPLMHDQITNHRLSMVGIQLEKSAAIKHLREELTRTFGGEYELLSTPFKENSLAVAILLPRHHLSKLQALLNSANIPEQYERGEQHYATVGSYLAELENSCRQVESLVAQTEQQRSEFQQRWGPYYISCREWLKDRLNVHNVHTGIHQTAMCFVINGWIPRDDVPPLSHYLEHEFAGKVTLQELKIHEQELEQVPIVLSNPPYFKPFEIFTRLLPLPRYTSFDPTPFLGLFFPIFFGMILGDAGYAMILFLLGVSGWMFLKQRPLLRDASQILTVCAGYTGLFGLLYGEFFGELGAHLIGLQPVIMSRSGALMPMMFFTLAVGGFHILMGLTLGVLESFLHRHIKEGAFRFLSLLVVTAIISVLITFFYPASQGLRQPLLISIGVAIPALVITGGFLAPLEMLKHIGHIISYTRIMAIGTTSVMLAYVANRLAGEAGSIAAGIAVAFLLHLFNLILGVFAPTVHSLRLHYVEFFSKFYESGGREYTPLKKP